MKKYLLLMAVIAAVILWFRIGEAQTVPAQGNFDVKTHVWNGVKGYYVTFTDVDSTDLVSGLTTDVFDWSDICNDVADAPNFRYAYTTTSANDTLKCLIDGYDPLTGNYNTLDTVGLTILSTTNGGTTTYGTVSLSTIGYSPQIRIKIIQKAATNDQADNGTFKIEIFGVPAITTDDRWRK